MSAEGSEPIGFDAIWQAIKGWDIQREHGAGYHGPTGDDVRTIIAAISAAGYAVVPREPTEAMIAAACDATATNDAYHRMNQGLVQAQTRVRYRAMLAAAEETPHG